MSMHNPPHPGELIKEVYLDPFNISYLPNEALQTTR